VKAYLGFADEYYKKMKERITMIDFCIFDFDNTLLRTDDLKFIREQGKKRASDENHRAELKSMIGDVKSRLIYLKEDLQDLRAKNSTTKFALFTLAPMAYLEIIDNLAFPDFFWDDVVCYESIYNNKYKPSGFGIEMLMERNGILDASRVVMVGDSIKDISAAYNAGCYAALDKSSWPRYKASQHWSAISYGRWLAVPAPTPTPTPTPKDLERQESKIQANALIAHGHWEKVLELLHCDDSARDLVKVIRSRDDYPGLLQAVDRGATKSPSEQDSLF
jgi:phosphoglycolate phosphatase-like HAD superfamily hydrolase